MKVKDDKRVAANVSRATSSHGNQKKRMDFGGPSKESGVYFGGGLFNGNALIHLSESLVNIFNDWFAHDRPLTNIKDSLHKSYAKVAGEDQHYGLWPTKATINKEGTLTDTHKESSNHPRKSSKKKSKKQYVDYLDGGMRRNEQNGEGSSNNKDDKGRERDEDGNEPEWEDGLIPVSVSGHDDLQSLEKGITVEFTESPQSLLKRNPPKRASAEEKELAELVHKVHLICLLARGRVVDNACDDPLIQFNTNFHVQNTRTGEKDFKSSLAIAIKNREGTAEERTPQKDQEDGSSYNNSSKDSSVSIRIKNKEVVTESSTGFKRKGDIEFDLQMEMALSATASAAIQNNLANESNELEHNLLSRTSSFRKMRRKETSIFIGKGSSAVWSRKAGPPLYWAEVYCSGENLTGRWIHVDAANSVVDGEKEVEAAAAVCRRPLRYVVAFAGHGAKDVTRRYCIQWYKISTLRINSQWWEEVLAPLKSLESSATGGTVCFEGKLGNAPAKVMEEKSSELSASRVVQSKMPNEMTIFQKRDSLEDMELETRSLTEPLPTNQQAYRSHHLYAIERWLTKYQILHPKGPVLGYCAGHPVYPRTCVQVLQSRQSWLREGLQVKANEVPAKVIKRSKKFGEVSMSIASEEDNGQTTVPLYGRWQMEPLSLPSAVDGMVPKNERGQVEVWSEKCLPPGTVHLRFPRLVQVVKRLEIDFAPAMVGFEYRSGRSFPVFDGIVVCTEFKEAIMALLSSIMTRQRLNASYGDGSTVLSDNSSALKDSQYGTSSSCKNNVKSSVPRRVDLRESGGNHEHVFPVDDQSFDEESSVRTKRCPCGFSIQMEEL
ncbi:hypothetical protein QJS10_CPB19g01376 [Acorus calamus]|uniref:Uncharacterized protein n=1 Tax=Acorus calamus TaxID=4465 RepID=A0AAV9CEA1_ACOCL|nr:hypothetical protein QJS10_CPB19g01376 [Acorus calamus]